MSRRSPARAETNVAKRRSIRRAWVAVAALIGAGVVVGSVVAGRIEWADNAAKLDAALAKAEPIQLLSISANEGSPERGVFAQVTSTGHLCLSDAPVGSPRMGGGGCNPIDDPLGGMALSASLAYEGGPAVESVTDARLFGLVSADVDSVRVSMSDGTSRSVKLKKVKIRSDDFQVFGYRFKKADLKKGIGPTAIVALDGDGAEIGRQPTGIG